MHFLFVIARGGKHMKRSKAAAGVLLSSLALLTALPTGVYAADGNEMYRLYNPNSGEHFYTANINERNHLVGLHWNYEGIGWVAPKSGKPVYRLYNPNAGDHHYTADIRERNMLTQKGWRYEGVGWQSGGSVPLYRQYNPNAKSGSHNYTTSKSENDLLVRIGWKAEGIAWYAVPAPGTHAGNVKDGTYEAVILHESGNYGFGFVNDAKIEDHSLIINGSLKRNGDKNYVTKRYVFPFDSATLFTFSGGEAPSEVATVNQFLEGIHKYNGLGLTLNVQNGKLVSGDISS